MVANETKSIVKPGSKIAIVEWEKPPVKFWLDLRRMVHVRDIEESTMVSILHEAELRDVYARKIQIIHRRSDVSQELIGKSQLYVLAITGLREGNGAWFFKRLRNE